VTAVPLTPCTNSHPISDRLRPLGPFPSYTFFYPRFPLLSFPLFLFLPLSLSLSLSLFLSLIPFSFFSFSPFFYLLLLLFSLVAYPLYRPFDPRLCFSLHFLLSLFLSFSAVYSRTCDETRVITPRTKVCNRCKNRERERERERKSVVPPHGLHTYTYTCYVHRGARARLTVSSRQRIYNSGQSEVWQIPKYNCDHLPPHLCSYLLSSSMTTRMTLSRIAGRRQQ